MTYSIMLDSGGYSAYTQGTEIFLDDYMQFIEDNKDYVDYYVNLDVIGDGHKSYVNYIQMVKEGFNPIPVFHIGVDERYLKKYLSMTDYVAIGAIAKMQTTSRLTTLDKVWHEFLTDEKGYPIAKIHGFGLTSFRIIRYFPWHCMTEEDHTVLTKSGWSGLSELKIGDEILSFNKGKSVWQKIQEIPVFDVTNATISHLENRNFNAMVSGNHRWLVSKEHTRGENYEWRTTNKLRRFHCVDRIGKYDFPKHRIYSDEFVSLLAWYWTDGSHSVRRPKCKKDSVIIWQSQIANPKKCEIIRSMIKSSGEKHWEGTSYGITQFELYGKIAEQILSIAPHKKLPTYLPYQLTREQAQLFVDHSVLADGTITTLKRAKGFDITVKRPTKQENLEILRIICLLLGIPTSISFGAKGYKSLRSSSVNYIYMAQVMISEKKYTGRLWCVQIPAGAFFTKCNNKIYVTGNSVDSSSWVQYGKFGIIIMPKYHNGDWKYDSDPLKIIVSSRKTNSSQHILNLPASQKKMIRRYLHTLGYDYDAVSTNCIARDTVNLAYLLGLQKIYFGQDRSLHLPRNDPFFNTKMLVKKHEFDPTEGKMYIAGNFPVMGDIEKERAVKDKYPTEFHRLISYYFKKDIQNVLQLKKEDNKCGVQNVTMT